jgi:hypothetical protein
MNSNPTLSGVHLQTYERIFRHPTSHNLTWREVRNLFAHLGEVEERPNGSLTVVRRGQSLVLRPAAGKDVDDIEELMRIRHFLKQTEAAPPSEKPDGEPMLVVINHHEARLYRTQGRGAAAQELHPEGPKTFFRHAHHSKEFARGREKPDPNSFFGPIAEELRQASRILVFGSGTGTSSEMEQLVAWLKAHHPDVAARIAGTAVIDEHHVTDGQLLAQARTAAAAP